MIQTPVSCVRLYGSMETLTDSTKKQGLWTAAWGEYQASHHSCWISMFSSAFGGLSQNLEAREALVSPAWQHTGILLTIALWQAAAQTDKCWLTACLSSLAQLIKGNSRRQLVCKKGCYSWGYFERGIYHEGFHAQKERKFFGINIINHDH